MDIKDMAAKAAREWAETIPRATWTKITACEAGYILGYEAAKAEAVAECAVIRQGWTTGKDGAA